MKTKRLRIFAGPNGSGKSELYQYLVSQHFFKPYFYVNADDIARSLPTGFSVLTWPVVASEEDFAAFLQKSSFLERLDYHAATESLAVSNSSFIWGGAASQLSYIAAAVADYLRNKLLCSESSFACETVFSHPSKLEFLRRARESGFKVYLYFISTKNPLINRNRVENRVHSGGHDVPPDKIESRYYKTMNNLFDAVRLSDRAFLFDNSESKESHSYLNFANYNAESGRFSYTADTAPSWFSQYVLKRAGM